nr:DUF6048 family protein [Persicobacter sp. CCB-QB2]
MKIKISEGASLTLIFSLILILLSSNFASAQYVDPSNRNDGIMDKDISLDSAELARMPARPEREKLGEEFKLRAVEGWFIPSYIRVGTDMVSWGRTAFEKGFTDMRIHADTDIGRWNLSVEMGRSTFSANRSPIEDRPLEPIYDYEAQGQYIKAGIDVNLTPRNWDNSMIFFGVRRADSFYSEDFSYVVNNVWGQTQESLSQSGNHTSWYEILFGYRTHVWQNFSAGMTGGVQLATNTPTDDLQSFVPSYAPGFGHLQRNTRYFLEFNIFYTIRFWDKGKPLAKPKK